MLKKWKLVESELKLRWFLGVWNNKCKEKYIGFDNRELLQRSQVIDFFGAVVWMGQSDFKWWHIRYLHYVTV